MGLAQRIIPYLDMNDGRIVKGLDCVDIRSAGDPVAEHSIRDANDACRAARDIEVHR